MAVAKYKVDYFMKDFDSIRSELISRIPIVSQGQLTDLNESSIAVTFVELFSSIGDTLGFYLDSNALEAFLPTTRQPENVYRHAKLIGYRIREISSARAYVQFSIPTALTGTGNEIFIPKGTRVGASTGNVGQFITQENTTIPVGQTVSETILAIQGIPRTSSFVADGTANQFVKLDDRSIDPTTITVYTGTTKWESQESFLYSQDQDYHYVTETDYLGVTRIYFGDGKFGRPPASGETISVSYLISSGDAGNVGANSITLVFSEIKTLNDIKITNLSVTNADPAAGGSARQSLEKVKFNAPGSLSALYRPVTKYDYNALIARIGGILHVNTWGEQEEDPPSYENMNWANIAIVPSNGGLPSENLKSIVRDYLLETQPVTVRLRFIDPDYVRVKLTLTVKIESGYSAEDIRIQISDDIRDFFALENVRFGQDLRASSFYKIALDIDGVDHVFVSDFVTVDDEGVETSIGQELILQKWQVPTLEALSVTVSTATELPEPDLYPDETI